MNKLCKIYFRFQILNQRKANFKYFFPCCIAHFFRVHSSSRSWAGYLRRRFSLFSLVCLGVFFFLFCVRASFSRFCFRSIRFSVSLSSLYRLTMDPNPNPWWVQFLATLCAVNFADRSGMRVRITRIWIIIRVGNRGRSKNPSRYIRRPCCWCLSVSFVNVFNPTPLEGEPIRLSSENFFQIIRKSYGKLKNCECCVQSEPRWS